MGARSYCGTEGVGRLRLASIALLVVVIGVLWTPRADADVERAGYYTYVMRSKTASALEQTAKRASCPPDTVVVGGGVYTSGSTLEDEVASSGPFDGPDADRRPDDGWLGEVNTGSIEARVDAHAVCAPFLGVRYLRKTISVPPGKQSSSTVACPSDSPDIFGGGVITRGGSTKVTLARSIADIDMGRYLWRFAVNNGHAKKISAVGFVICGDPSTAGSSHVRVVRPAPPGQTSDEVYCGSSQVSGGGVWISAGLEGEIASLIPVDDSSDPDSAPDDGWKAWTNNQTTADKRRAVQVICQH